MIARWLLAGALTALLVRPALAQQPLVFSITGPCVMALDEHQVACRQVAYMAFPSNHRISFTAVTSQATWAFSGDEDDNDDGDYTLTVDSILSPQAGRFDAEGECEMQVAEDGKTVTSLECEAKTEAGNLTLKASGVVASNDDDDDDDDDTDQG